MYKHYRHAFQFSWKVDAKVMIFLQLKKQSAEKCNEEALPHNHIRYKLNQTEQYNLSPHRDIKCHFPYQNNDF